MKGVYQGMDGYYAAKAQEQADAEAAGLTEQARDHAGLTFETTTDANLFVAHGIVDLKAVAARIVRQHGA